MKRVLTICLLALAPLAAGCGGDDADKDEYEREVREVGQTLESTFGSLGTSISGSGNTEEAATKLEEGASSLDRASQELGDIDPPSEIEGPHDDLVEGLGELADQFRQGAEAAEGGDLDQLLQFASTLQSSEAVQKITKAGEEIESEGYDFDPGN
jgi:hypothetical protein